jgi:hypothetical protein
MDPAREILNTISRVINKSKPLYGECQDDKRSQTISVLTLALNYKKVNFIGLEELRLKDSLGGVRK